MITDRIGSDVICRTEDDLEGSMLLAVTTKRAAQMLTERIEEKAAEYGDLRTMQALKKTIDRIAP